jgi:hypothetical protein
MRQRAPLQQIWSLRAPNQSFPSIRSQNREIAQAEFQEPGIREDRGLGTLVPENGI